MTEIGADWWLLDGEPTAWFEASSLTQAAALAGWALEVMDDVALDLRSSGLRVRLGSGEHAEAVSTAARDLGLSPGPGALQRVAVVLESGRPDDVRAFWQPVLGFDARDDVLVDPLRRDPTFRVQPSDEPRAARDRWHVDVVRPPTVVEALSLGEGAPPYGLCHRDPDGTEVDVVPGDPLGENADADDVSDWQLVFGAMACYRTTSVAQQRDLAAAVSAHADDAGFPLLVDLRPGLVVIDSGKDQSWAEAHGLDVDFTDLARRIQSTALALGATADPILPRFVQLFLGAADPDAVRPFWTAALGYVPDRREGLGDLHDPRRLDPVLVLQQIEVDDVRRRQRNRVVVELAVPTDQVDRRVADAMAAGGRVVEQGNGSHRLADPEGNELVVVAGS